MNNFLRLTLAIIFAFVCSWSFSQTMFDFDKEGTTLLGLSGESSSESSSGDITEAKTAKIGNISITVSAKEEGTKTPNRIWHKSPKLRMYSGTMTIASSDKKITEIQIVAGKWSGKANNGTLTNTKSNEQTWTGSENTVVFNISDNTQIDTITVYVEGEAAPVTAPKISGTTPFTESTTVTITADEGASIYYTTDGTNPTKQSTAYTAPFSVNATTTVKAIAYDANGKASEVSTETFTKADKVATTGDGTLEKPYTTKDALALIAGNANTTDQVYVKGIISAITEVSTKFGNATFTISDDGKDQETIIVYRVKYLDNTSFTAEDQIKVGDNVIMKAVLTKYKETSEIAKGYIYSLNGNTTTGINKIINNASDENAPVYNLAGQRVDKSYKGIVIKKGKKYFNK